MASIAHVLEQALYKTIHGAFDARSDVAVTFIFGQSNYWVILVWNRMYNIVITIEDSNIVVNTYNYNWYPSDNPCFNFPVQNPTTINELIDYLNALLK